MVMMRMMMVVMVMIMMMMMMMMVMLARGDVVKDTRIHARSPNRKSVQDDLVFAP
jgi:nitric oxide reductase large subunit